MWKSTEEMNSRTKYQAKNGHETDICGLDNESRRLITRGGSLRDVRRRERSMPKQVKWVAPPAPAPPVRTPIEVAIHDYRKAWRRIRALSRTA